MFVESIIPFVIRSLSDHSLMFSPTC